MAKEKTDTFVDELAAEAGEQLKELRKYRIYAGTSSEPKARAKLAVGVIGAYVRLRATLANERAIDLAMERLSAPERPALPGKTNG